MEKLEKVIMLMATEIKNLQEGKQPQFSDGNEKVLEETRELLETSNKDNAMLKEKLEEVKKERDDAAVKVDILTKVVETVNNNVKVTKTSKDKKNIRCKDFTKPTGCSWGERCKFDHSGEAGLVKTKDCAYWEEGQCRFSDKVCWNIHDTAKKGTKPKESVFQESQEVQEVPPAQVESTSRMEDQGWEVVRGKNYKKKVTARERTTPQETPEGQGSKGAVTPTFCRDGKKGEQTPTFPLDGESNPQQVLLQAIQTLLQQAGGSQ